MNLLKGVNFFLPAPPVDLAGQRKHHGQHQVRALFGDGNKRVGNVLFFAGFSLEVLEVVVGAIAGAVGMGSGQVIGGRNREKTRFCRVG